MEAIPVKLESLPDFEMWFDRRKLKVKLAYTIRELESLDDSKKKVSGY